MWSAYGASEKCNNNKTGSNLHNTRIKQMYSGGKHTSRLEIITKIIVYF